MTKPTQRKTVMHVRGVPQDLKDHFKAACALRNKSMNGTIIQLIRKYVEETKK